MVLTAKLSGGDAKKKFWGLSQNQAEAKFVKAAKSHKQELLFPKNGKVDIIVHSDDVDAPSDSSMKRGGANTSVMSGSEFMSFLQKKTKAFTGKKSSGKKSSGKKSSSKKSSSKKSSGKKKKTIKKKTIKKKASKKRLASKTAKKRSASKPTKKRSASKTAQKRSASKTAKKRSASKTAVQTRSATKSAASKKKQTQNQKTGLRKKRVFKKKLA